MGCVCADQKVKLEIKWKKTTGNAKVCLIRSPRTSEIKGDLDASHSYFCEIQVVEIKSSIKYTKEGESSGSSREGCMAEKGLRNKLPFLGAMQLSWVISFLLRITSFVDGKFNK